ncbi:MAG: hypothetical protein ABL933_06750 [Methyloglobulus sp.]|nr:hypothetical protein [Methyloglobulus sp.]
MNIKPWQNIQLLPIALMAVMALTRLDHFGSAISLPDASLAVFFLAGMGLSGLWLFALLLLEAGIIDFVAISQFSVSDFCISPAYGFLIPTYAVMWFAGRYAKAFAALHIIDAVKTVGLAVIATTGAFVISNGSFYLMSGRFGELSLTQYFNQLAQYLPPYLSSALIYIVIGLVIVKLWQVTRELAVAES